jgi:chromosome segregation and condensation protein ScpB
MSSAIKTIEAPLATPKNAPRTGLAGRMRAWMAAQVKPFTAADVSIGLGVPPGKGREKVSTVLRDFSRRGEIIPEPEKRIRRQNIWRYRYNASWKPNRPAILAEKACKAMRIISFHEPFSLADIQKITGQKRNYIDKLAHDLLAAGHLRKEGYRRRRGSYGREAVYRVVDTDRFLIEVMR